MKTVTNWGRYPTVQADWMSARNEGEAREALAASEPLTLRGNGRSYGDASLGDRILSMRAADCFLGFDEASGVLHCQAGVLLDQILAFCVPRGWFLPVTPGTRFITVGGAIAADVHGKNHHRDGSFGRHVLFLRLMTEDGTIQTVSPRTNAPLFQATCGGMGLTGIILDAQIQLIPIETAYIRETLLPCPNLDTVLDQLEATSDATYSVAWIDCLARGTDMGRSLLMLGEHARREELPPEKAARPLPPHAPPRLSYPLDGPAWVLNSWTIRLFNQLYYRRIHTLRKEVLTHYEPFFYPLDAILNWNRMYGRRGFTQYQFVLPMESTREGLHDLLNEISRSGKGSFLAVLKLFGEQDTGLLSFPMKGCTLALDFPMAAETPAFLRNLDDRVAAYGGRLYLAKDACMSEAMFTSGYPRLNDFLDLVQSVNPDLRFRTHQTQRLGITP